MRANILLTLVLVPLLFLGACDGGSNSNGDNNVSETPVNPPIEPPATPPGEVLTGFLLDSAVSGVAYETPTLKGVTGVNGSFQYREGEAVNFKLGDTLLGRIIGQAEVTPFDLAGADAVTGIDIYSALNNEYDLSFHAVINIIVLLQSLDRDADPGNGIEISPDVSALLLGVKLDVIEDWATFQREAALLHALAEANMRALFDTPRAVAKPGPALKHLYATMGVKPRTVRLTGEEEVSGSVDPTQHWVYTSADVLEQFKLLREDGSLETQANYEFDANGNLTEEAVDANGDGLHDYNVVYQYNSHGDPTLEVQDEGLDGLPESTTSWEYQYDNHNKKIKQSEIDFDGVWKTINDYEYDDKGNLTYHKWVCNAAVYDLIEPCFEQHYEGEVGRIEDRISTYEYDARGNTIRATVDVTADGTQDEVNIYEYDVMGNLTWDDNEHERYEYDANWNVIRKQHYNGDGIANGYDTFQYDDSGRVAVSEEGVSGRECTVGNCSRFVYEYDSNGNLTKKEEDVNKDGTLEHIQTWTYDTNNRLIRIDHDNPGTESDSIETFEYDGGNLVRHVYPRPPLEELWTYEYDVNDYLTSENYVFGFGFLEDAACEFCPHFLQNSTRYYEAGTWQNVLIPVPDAPPPPIIGDRPITDTVTADGKEWLQPADFLGYTYDQVSVTCPAGVCSGTLPGSTFDLTGYTWASIDEVSALFNSYGLSQPFTGPFQERFNDPNVNAAIAQDFAITAEECYGDCPVTFLFVAGMVRDPAPAGEALYIPYILYIDETIPPGPTDLYFSNTVYVSSTSARTDQHGTGVWFWR
jgi:hypothetical protein